jgi:hypothetical protein
VPRSVHRSRAIGLASAMALALLLLIPIASASASGGVNPDGEGTNSETVPGSKAKLVKGKAVAPAEAPKRVQKVIASANKIRNKPYRLGGGHGKWNDRGYDCSGAVSYALHGAKLLNTPLDSSGLARYGQKRKGQWITVYGASGHAYMVVAGLRFDTSMVKGNGPGWSKQMRSTPESYKARHPRGL